MLLGNDLLALARAWQYREKIEREAADQFSRLAGELSRAGLPAVLVDMAEDAAVDERRHAEMCRRIVNQLHPGLARLQPRLGVALGPRQLSPPRRALYASVAISCVTESLSAALLLEIHERATDDLVRRTAHDILKDEVSHSRLGWAHLALAAEQGDVQWLGSYVPAMLDAAIASDVAPMSAEPVDGSGYGILPASVVADIAQATIDQVIHPGLARFGVLTSASSPARP